MRGGYGLPPSFDFDKAYSSNYDVANMKLCFSNKTYDFCCIRLRMQAERGREDCRQQARSGG